MVFHSEQALVIGATSGIGAGLAEKLINESTNVIVVGRRQERLDAFVQKHGADKASSVRFDVTDDEGLDDFVNGSVLKFFILPHLHGLGTSTDA